MLSFDSAGLVRIHGCGIEDVDRGFSNARAFLVMEYCNGGDLSNALPWNVRAETGSRVYALEQQKLAESKNEVEGASAGAGAGPGRAANAKGETRRVLPTVRILRDVAVGMAHMSRSTLAAGADSAAAENKAEGKSPRESKDLPFLHRDLSTDNVLLCIEGDSVQAKVCDFGLAQRADDTARVGRGSCRRYSPEVSDSALRSHANVTCSHCKTLLTTAASATCLCLRWSCTKPCLGLSGRDKALAMHANARWVNKGLICP